MAAKATRRTREAGAMVEIAQNEHIKSTDALPVRRTKKKKTT